MKTSRFLMIAALVLALCLAISTSAQATPSSSKYSNCDKSPSEKQRKQDKKKPELCKQHDKVSTSECTTTTAEKCKKESTRDCTRTVEKCEKVRATITGCVELCKKTATSCQSCEKICKPLTHVHLRLVDREGKTICATQSKKDGCYVFKNIKPGTYKLTAKAKCYKLITELPKEIVVTTSGTIKIPTIKFTK